MYKVFSIIYLKFYTLHLYVFSKLFIYTMMPKIPCTRLIKSNKISNQMAERWSSFWIILSTLSTWKKKSRGQTREENCRLRKILHYCSRRCRRLQGRSSPGCQWKSLHSPAPSSGGWFSPSGGNRTGDNRPNTACTAEDGKIQRRPQGASQAFQQQRMWYAQQDNK